MEAKIVIGLARPESPARSAAPSAATGSGGSKRRPFAVWVIFLGLVFAGLDLLLGISPDLAGGSAFDVFFVPLVLGFCLLCFVAAAASLTMRRLGYVLAIVASLGFVIPSLTVVVPTFSTPSNFETFAVAVSSIPVLVLVAVFSILGLLNAKKGFSGKKYLASPKSAGGALAAVVILIVIVGLLAGASQAAAKSFGPGSFSAVSIVLGANNPSNPGGSFVPSHLTVVIGVNNTVTWTNNDYSVHTVTSASGAFGSGLLNKGNTWSYTFKSPGNFTYHCEIHPYMTGNVLVKAA